MPSYETPSKREVPGDEANYQPGTNANASVKAEVPAEPIDNTPEAEDAEERKAITWSDLAEEKEKSDDEILAPLLESGPRAPCLITPDGSAPAFSIRPPAGASVFAVTPASRIAAEFAQLACPSARAR